MRTPVRPRSNGAIIPDLLVRRYPTVGHRIEYRREANTCAKQDPIIQAQKFAQAGTSTGVIKNLQLTQLSFWSMSGS